MHLVSKVLIKSRNGRVTTIVGVNQNYVLHHYLRSGCHVSSGCNWPIAAPCWHEICLSSSQWHNRNLTSFQLKSGGMYNFVFNHQCNYPEVCFNQSPDSKQKFPQTCNYVWQTPPALLPLPCSRLDRNNSEELKKILQSFRITDRAAGVARLQRGAVWRHQELERCPVWNQT